MDWISCAERLPDEGTYVLGWNGSFHLVKIEKGITEEQREKMKAGQIEDSEESGWCKAHGWFTIKRSEIRAPLNILRAASDEKIFRQAKQKSARRVYPLRRIFVTNDGKDSIDSSCEEFLEVPIIKSCDVWGNNLVPYSWRECNGNEIFGQKILYWMPLPPPPIPDYEKKRKEADEAIKPVSAMNGSEADGDEV